MTEKSNYGNYTDYRKHWTGILILLGVFLVIIKLIETDLVLNRFISPPVNIKLDDWLLYYQKIAVGGLGLSLLAVGVWYYWGSRRAKAYTGNDLARATAKWWQLLGGLGLVWLIGIFLIGGQEGAWLVYLFNAINIGGFYYLATVWFSPVLVMYAPPGAIKLRFWR